MEENERIKLRDEAFNEMFKISKKNDNSHLKLWIAKHEDKTPKKWTDPRTGKRYEDITLAVTYSEEDSEENLWRIRL